MILIIFLLDGASLDLGIFRWLVRLLLYGGFPFGGFWHSLLLTTFGSHNPNASTLSGIGPWETKGLESGFLSSQDVFALHSYAILLTLPQYAIGAYQGKFGASTCIPLKRFKITLVAERQDPWRQVGASAQTGVKLVTLQGRNLQCDMSSHLIWFIFTICKMHVALCANLGNQVQKVVWKSYNIRAKNKKRGDTTIQCV